MAAVSVIPELGSAQLVHEGLLRHRFAKVDGRLGQFRVGGEPTHGPGRQGHQNGEQLDAGFGEAVLHLLAMPRDGVAAQQPHRSQLLQASHKDVRSDALKRAGQEVSVVPGPAKVFVIASLGGLAATLLALASGPYRRLSRSYGHPSAAATVTHQEVS